VPITTQTEISSQYQQAEADGHVYSHLKHGTEQNCSHGKIMMRVRIRAEYNTTNNDLSTSSADEI
jgi:hypothetical protein